jgi:adenosine deaminase
MNPMVRMIMGRVHVSTSDREVVEYINKKFTAKARFDPNISETRKSIYRDALAQHKVNQEEYDRVMYRIF